MKTLILIISLIFAVSCSTPDIYTPCADYPEKVRKKELIPLQEGNSWTYNVLSINKWGDKSYKTITLSIDDLDTLRYYDGFNFQKTPAWKVVSSISDNEQFYYLRCTEGISLVRTDKSDPDLIKTGVKFEYKKAGTYLSGSKFNFRACDFSDNYSYFDKVLLNVPLINGDNEYKCFLYETWVVRARVRGIQIDLKNKEYLSMQRFFQPGIGLVKYVKYNSQGGIITQWELSSYKVNTGSELYSQKK